MKKRQRKKNNRTPKWLKKFRKENNITMITPKRFAREMGATCLQTGQIGTLFGCSIVTDPIYPNAKLRTPLRGRADSIVMYDDAWPEVKPESSTEVSCQHRQ